ncbi:hypothetical protein [Anaeromyxobacter oryzisoli]|uniref:hypothetical protein n=1 Tax=Anaeromyxobacter oryzisoli TaxID=2925408 RepID=UPI001F593BA6|nr:hypothetical protein [Anaeromyxobacter sp. SG63]
MISATASSPAGAGLAALDHALGDQPAVAARHAAAARSSRVGVLVASIHARRSAALSTSSSKKTGSTSSSRRSTRTRTASSAGYASKTSATTTATSKDLAFLSDAKLSTDDKLFRFMAYMSSKYDAQLEQKMKELGGGAPASGTLSSSSSASKKKGLFGGLLGKVVKAAFPGAALSLDLLKNKTVQGLVKSVSGPVLSAAATALGAPQLAPVLLKAGPDVATALIGVAEHLDLDAGSGSGSAKASGASSSGSGASKASSASSSGTAKNEQMQLMELQRLYEKQKEMMTLVSNLMRAQHDMRMNAINNVR